MIKSLIAIGSVFIVNCASASSYTVEVYCLDQVTRLSYGAAGDHIAIEKGAIIKTTDRNGKVFLIDLNKGECKIQLAHIPDPYEG